MNPIQEFIAKLIANYIQWDEHAPNMPQRLHYSEQDLKQHFGWTRMTNQRVYAIVSACRSYGIQTTTLPTGINFTLYKNTMVANYRDFAYKETQ